MPEHDLAPASLIQQNSPLRRARWAEEELSGIDQFLLSIDMGVRPVHMIGSTATGEPLISNDHLGADIIRLAAGEGFAPHTHPGDHLLIIIGGEGTITAGGTVAPTRAGDILLVEGDVAHAVGAISDLVILAVGSPHRAIDALDRMTPVEYQAITADIDDLFCQLCEVHARYPQRLHESGCPHCPCSECRGASTVDRRGEIR